MDKLSRQEQVWLTVFTAALVSPKHGFADAYDIAGAAARLFKQQFGEDAAAVIGELADERDEARRLSIYLEKSLQNVKDNALTSIGGYQAELAKTIKRMHELEQELEISKSNERAAVKCFREDLTRAHARIDNFQVVKDGLERELNKANGRNFELQKEFNDYKEDAFTARTELAGKLERRDAEIQELRTLLEEMTKSISERDELIAKIRAERDEFEGRLISNMTREALRLDV